ncbi:MAG: hypothetical protein P9X24_17115 [Candidatus Hatepunaea meridiana]|nr:hypothetical protein [Candidatus Hatepunaea meridiana]
MIKQRTGTHFVNSGWQVSIYGNKTIPIGPDWKADFSTLLNKFKNPDSILKHDNRSDVGTFKIGGLRYVIKKFTFQSTNTWLRLTSVFFPTQGEIACRNSLEMASVGINTPQPALLMQRTRGKVVANSWLVYRFVEGQPLTKDNTEDIVEFVKNMHRSGWIHRDPHPGNFISTPEGIITIDPIKARQTNNHYLKAYDVVLMEHDMPAARDIYGRNELGRWFTYAKAGHALLKFYRSLKYSIRRLLGIYGNRTG